MSLPPGDYDSYDFMRAHTWDLDGITTVWDLLGIIGGAGRPLAEQRQLVADWLKTPAAVPAPAGLKADAEEFAHGATGAVAGEAGP